jgi:Mg/Co/Ni transporter MgtE
MSGPFISTLVDVAGLVLYMEVSLFILGRLGELPG